MMIDARDVRHDAQREHGEARQRAAREHVEQAQDAALLALEQLLQLVRVDARHRDVRTDAVDHERQQQEDQPATQVAELAALGQLIRVELTTGYLLCVCCALRSLAAGAASTLPPARFDRRLGAGGRADALEARPCACSSPLLMTLTVLTISPHQAGGLQRRAGRLRPRPGARSSPSVISALYFSSVRLEAALGQAALQRHLAAFEADLVVAAGTRLLALVAAARGLAQAEPMPRPTRRRAFLLPAAGLDAC